MRRWSVASISELPVGMLPAALAEASAVVAAIAARMAQSSTLAPSTEDRLLDVDAAAEVLGVSTDFLYGSPTVKTLRVRVGGRVLFQFAAPPGLHRPESRPVSRCPTCGAPTQAGRKHSGSISGRSGRGGQARAAD